MTKYHLRSNVVLLSGVDDGRAKIDEGKKDRNASYLYVMQNSQGMHTASD